MQEAQLLAAKESNKMYYVEYTFKKPEDQKRHLVSLIALGNNGRYVALNVLQLPGQLGKKPVVYHLLCIPVMLKDDVIHIAECTNQCSS